MGADISRRGSRTGIGYSIVKRSGGVHSGSPKGLGRVTSQVGGTALPNFLVAPLDYSSSLATSLYLPGSIVRTFYKIQNLSTPFISQAHQQ